MKPELRPIYEETVRILQADPRVLAAYMTGSVGTEREDDYADVDPFFLVSAEHLESLDRDLPSVFERAGVSPVLWWPERVNCETLRNYAVLFRSAETLLQYDITIQAWDGTPFAVRPGALVFDKTGGLREADSRPVPGWEPSRLRWTVEIYWVYVYIHAKYLKRRDPFRLAAAQRELFDAHLSILHALSPEVAPDWWPLLAARVANATQQTVLRSYLSDGDAEATAAAMAAQLDQFSRDAQAACERWNETYPAVLDAAIREHLRGSL